MNPISSQTIAADRPALIYQPDGSRPDEVFAPDGTMRGHWSYLMDSLQTLGATAFEERCGKASRILRDDGATYNIYNDQQAPARPWRLDLVPSLISSEEWAQIESALLERAELFNLLLRDIYGPRKLLRHGVIPPEALFCHGGFLRACDGISLPGEHDLILHAVDMMRGPGGDICVLADRTQCPSGAGYALENRTVMSRVWPSLFRDSHVHRLAAFFQRLRSKLTSLAIGQDQPQVVVLTPGAHNETYFEHAYLANYLGLHLVQGSDLVVRNGYVWMKSLEGLSRVDVILRRVDDSYCDPVELRSDSRLGVPNLLDVVRAGRVVVANPLGSGILENPVLLRYLPAIARALLGRELRMDSVATYWCGDEQDCRYVLDRLGEMVIKPVWRGSTGRSVQAHSLTADELAQLAGRIRRQPAQFVAQPLVAASCLPVYANGQLQPRPAILRSFAVAADTSYAIMPGGLTRVGSGLDTFNLTSQSGSCSKDTWVIATEPERIDSQAGRMERRAASPIEMVSLPSRVVENLFWMGRYAERAECSLRLLRTAFFLLNGERAPGPGSRRVLLATVSQVTATMPGFVEADDAQIAAPEQALWQLVGDGSMAGSVSFNLQAMLQCADQCKELMSPDMLRILSDMGDELAALNNTLNGGFAYAPEEALNPLITIMTALIGLTQESMVRGSGWRFNEIGRRLERGLLTGQVISGLVASGQPQADQDVLVHAMLLSLEVLITYRRRYGTGMDIANSLDLVLMDTDNPRSLLYQLERLQQHISELPRADGRRHELPAELRYAVEAATGVKLLRLDELAALDDSGHHGRLLDSLAETRRLLATISDAISSRYFDHRESSQQLVQGVWEVSE